MLESDPESIESGKRLNRARPIKHHHHLLKTSHQQHHRKHLKVHFPVATGRKLNLHKTFKRRPGRLLNVLDTFNLRPVSTGLVRNNPFVKVFREPKNS